jgi:hypothetical protein
MPGPRLIEVVLVALDQRKLLTVVNVVDKIADDVDQVVLQQAKTEVKLYVVQRVITFQIHEIGPVKLT